MNDDEQTAETVQTRKQFKYKESWSALKSNSWSELITSLCKERFLSTFQEQLLETQQPLFAFRKTVAQVVAGAGGSWRS